MHDTSQRSKQPCEVAALTMNKKAKEAKEAAAAPTKPPSSSSLFRFRSSEKPKQPGGKRRLFRRSAPSVLLNTNNGSSAASKELREDPLTATSGSSEELVVKQTKIVTVQGGECTAVRTAPVVDLPKADSSDTTALATGPYCATAILQHSYLEYMCGSRDSSSAAKNNSNSNYPLSSDDDKSLYHSQQHHATIPDDPTVQESIECVFYSQLEQGLPQMLLEDDDEVDVDDEHVAATAARTFTRSSSAQPELMAPSRLQQSLLKNRSDARYHAHRHHSLVDTNNSSSPSSTAGNNKQQQQRKQHSFKTNKIHTSLKHVGTFDPARQYHDTGTATTSTAPTAAETVSGARACRAQGECSCQSQRIPIMAPQHWPQGPLMMRPAPESTTRIKGIRFCSSETYLWSDSSSTLQWPAALQKHWNLPVAPDDGTTAMEVMCAKCMIMPVNNGNEPAGESLVTDFESDYFVGTLMVRIRGTEGTTVAPYDDSVGYFAGMNRRYQVVISGKFKKPVVFTECMSGFKLTRPIGKLPPKFIFKGALKVVSFFAPQLQAKPEGPTPSCLTPFGSTPQAVIVRDEDEPVDLEAKHEEPVEASKTLLGKALESSSTMQRARFRKKAFDKLFTQKDKSLVADTSKVYTFESLQHLFNFQDFTIELGSFLGAVRFREILDGQPLQIMALHGNDRMWCFDVYHECLMEDAKRQEKMSALS